MEDLEYEAKKRILEDEDSKRDIIRNMALMSLIGILTYPIYLWLAGFFGLNEALKELSAVAGSFFTTCGLIVMTFIGAKAYENKKSEDK